MNLRKPEARPSMRRGGGSCRSLEGLAGSPSVKVVTERKSERKGDSLKDSAAVSGEDHGLGMGLKRGNEGWGKSLQRG